MDFFVARSYKGPTLFIGGDKSTYIPKDSHEAIRFGAIIAMTRN